MVSTRQKSSIAASSASPSHLSTFETPVNSVNALKQAYRPTRNIKALPMRRKSAMSEDTKPSAQALAALMNQPERRLPLSPVRSCSNGAASIPISSSQVQSYRFPAYKASADVSKPIQPAQPPSLPYLLPSPVLISPFIMPDHATVILPDLSSIQLAPIRNRPQAIRLRRPSINKSHSAPGPVRTTRCKPPTPVVSKHPSRGMTSPSLASISLTQAFKLAERSQAKMESYNNLRLAPIAALPAVPRSRKSQPKRKVDDEEMDFQCCSDSIVAKRRGRVIRPLDLGSCEVEGWYAVA